MDIDERFYRSMRRIKRVEEEIVRVYPSDKIKSPVHLSIGQESISVGVCEALRPQDVLFPSYRSHASYLAKGGNLCSMIAELYGKATGCCKGKGGSMHLIDVDAGVMGSCAPVGSQSAHATGYAYAMQQQRRDTVTVCFIGDGATEEGIFWESLNFAALHHLNIIFIVENNGWAIHTPQAARQGRPDITLKAKAFGLSTVNLNYEVHSIYDAVQQAVKDMSAVDALSSTPPGPRLIECTTQRAMEHVGPNEDYEVGYRERPNIDLSTISIESVGSRLDPDLRHSIDAVIDAEITEAFQFAEDSPFPDDAELYTEVFSV